MATAPKSRSEGSEFYTFPAPTHPDAAEWPGTPLGLSNVITRTKSRTAQYNKTVDSTPGLLDDLLKSAHQHLARRAGTHPIYIQDVMIHGIRVRVTTDSPHLYDFWLDNWYSPEEWRKLTGQSPEEARVKVYALVGVTDQEVGAYYSRAANTILFFNTSYYGQLKSWVLGAVGRLLASEFGIHSIHSACVEKQGNGVLYIAPTGTGKSTSSYGLMEFPETRFHSDDWVYVRYAYAARDGRRVLVHEAEGSDGSRARGYQVHRWIERHARDGAARLRALGLDNRPVELILQDLDLARPTEAYAYTSEKHFYLRTNLAENFPASICELVRSKKENVPDVSPEFLASRAETLGAMLDGMATGGGDGCAPLRGKTPAELRELCARLIAFENARALLDMAQVLPPQRVYVNPAEPLRLAAVILLKRNVEDRTVLNHLKIDAFMERLLIGETPDKKRETAYNAYRAVDDPAERAIIEHLEKSASAEQPIYRLFEASKSAPESLREEFEMFRVLYYAARTYDLNTTLQRDPTVRDKADAVHRTMKIIARVLDTQPVDIRLTIDNYKEFLA